MNDKVSILLVGIGGYAGTYVNPLLGGDFPDCEIVGCADPFPSSCPRLDEIKERNIPVFSSMDEFFDAGLTADLAVISTPIHFHARQILQALEHGCHVLCEKPLCGDANDIDSLIEAEKKSGKYIGIGYQWSHSEAILELKRDILAGLYGEPVLLKTIVLWPRGFAYYGRGSGWAGKLKASDGSLILDSVANNAAAHYLHNIFFVLGDKIDTSASPKSVKAELKRANDIENYDTCRIEMEFEGGAKGLYLVSHATEEAQDPLFDYRFTKGRAVFDESGDEKVIRGIFGDGTVKVYGNPFIHVTNKLRRAVDAVKDPSVKPYCGIEASAVHTRCIAEIQKYGIGQFAPDDIVIREDGSGIYVRGLREEMMNEYNNA